MRLVQGASPHVVASYFWRYKPPKRDVFFCPLKGLGECATSDPLLSLTPVLVESQIQRLSEAAETLIPSILCQFDPKQLNSKKTRISKELEVWDLILHFIWPWPSKSLWRFLHAFDFRSVSCKPLPFVCLVNSLGDLLTLELITLFT